MRCLGRPGQENQQENHRKAPGWTSKQDIRERGGPGCPMRYPSQSPFRDSQYQGSSHPILFSAAHSYVFHRHSFFFHSRECRGHAWKFPRQPPVLLLAELSGKASGTYLPFTAPHSRVFDPLAHASAGSVAYLARQCNFSSRRIL